MNRVNIEILLGTLLIAVTGAILLLIGLNEEERMAEFVDYQAAHEIEVGAELFEINCRGCHGLKAEGIPGLAPPLNDAYFFTQRLTDVGWQGSLEDYIVATISTGRQLSTRPDLYPGSGLPAMPTWSERFGGPLRDDQIQALAAFIMNYESTASGEIVLVELPSQPNDATNSDDPLVRGQAIYETSGCGGCHAIDGLSVGAVGPALTNIATVAGTRIEGLSAEEYIRQSIVNPEAYLVEGYDNLMLKTFADTLSDQQLEDLIAFLLAQE
ncbi:MAG: c-type cytochrome [Anaerolineales bacterium]|nr:c-type cytochrome [Anaerolineales bacterium]